VTAELVIADGVWIK